MKNSAYLICLLIACASAAVTGSSTAPQSGLRQSVVGAWQMQTSFLVKDDGAVISSSDYQPQAWLAAPVPTTVLNALVKNGIYPDVRLGLNTFRVPDASDEFNPESNVF
jgi:hypothetical protein